MISLGTPFIFTDIRGSVCISMCPFVPVPFCHRFLLLSLGPGLTVFAVHFYLPYCIPDWCGVGGGGGGEEGEFGGAFFFLI